MMNQNVCPQCGAPLGAGATECKYCGEVVVVAGGAVQQEVTPQSQSQAQQPPVTPVQQVYGGNPAISPSWPLKSKTTAGILGILLGGIGAHKFYLGKVGQGIVYLLFCWTYIPSFIGFIEGIVYLSSNDENFQLKHRVRLR